ncbi:MAG: Kelch repeat-containing protein [Parvularculaceae bacterium]
MDRRTFLMASGAAMTAPALARASKGPAGRWAALTDMPFAAQEIYPAAYRCGGEPVVVVAGGITAGDGGRLGVTDACAYYVPVADIWNLAATLPAPRHHLALASTKEALFAIGGFAADLEGQWRMQQSVWRIDDLNREAWRLVAPLPAPQAEAVTLEHEGAIHIIGGRTPKSDRNQDWRDQTDTGTHWRYDPQADRWEPRAPLPVARNSAAGAALGDALFVISGRTVAGGNTPVCHAYDPKADEWRTIAPLPAPRTAGAPAGQGGLAAAAMKGRIYAFGGEWFGAGASAGVYPDAFSYDPKTDRWRREPDMARPRHGLGAVALGEAIYAVGGATGPSAEGTSALADQFTAG